ncbi:hypothetical protein M422DRAFT_194065, partial [Sphaerobolus stellatus SS14]
FGRRITWVEDTEMPAGHKLSFAKVMYILAENLQLHLAAPVWAYQFSKKLQAIRLSGMKMGSYMREMVAERRENPEKQGQSDLFHLLLESVDDSETVESLTDGELIGDIFISLIAGHETSGHALCFALGLLALYPDVYPDEQQKLYYNIISVTPKDRTPTYDCMGSLTYPLAVLYETLRMLPLVQVVPKVTTEDMTIPAVRADGTTVALPAPKGTIISLDVPPLHFNSEYEQ